MSFPVIAANNFSVEGANTTSHTVNLPADIEAGNLLVVFLVIDANTNITWPGGWTGFFEKGTINGCRVECAWRKATGSEGGTIIATSANAQKSAHGSFRITGAENPLIQPPVASNGAQDNTVNPDSDNLIPSGGAKDYLWISVQGNDTDATPSNSPADMTLWGTLNSGSGLGHCVLGIAYKNNHVASYNPAAWTLPSAQKWNAGTIAILPPGTGNALFLGFNF